MVYCRHCGKELEERANFCPYCGASARCLAMPSPVIPYSSPRKRNDLVIVAIVLVVVIVLPIVLAAVMYVMVMGISTEVPPSPSASLSVEKSSGDLLSVTVLGVSRNVALTEVWIDLDAPQGPLGVNVGYNKDPASNRSMGGNGHYTLCYHDVDGDGMLGGGDWMAVTSTIGPLDSGVYSIGLIYLPTGATIARTDATMP